MSAAVLIVLPGISDYQLLKGQGQAWLVCTLGPAQDQANSSPESEADGTKPEHELGFLLPESFQALQRRPVCDKSHIRTLSPGAAAGPFPVGTLTS